MLQEGEKQIQMSLTRGNNLGESLRKGERPERSRLMAANTFIQPLEPYEGIISHDGLCTDITIGTPTQPMALVLDAGTPLLVVKKTPWPGGYD